MNTISEKNAKIAMLILKFTYGIMPLVVLVIAFGLNTLSIEASILRILAALASGLILIPQTTYIGAFSYSLLIIFAIGAALPSFESNSILILAGALALMFLSKK